MKKPISDNAIAAICILSGLAILTCYFYYNKYQSYHNSRYTSGKVMSVNEGTFLNYQYQINGVMYVNLYVHEDYGTHYGDEYRKRIGQHFLVQFNQKNPDYSVIYLSCQMEDTLSAPTDGWTSPPINCAGLK